MVGRRAGAASGKRARPRRSTDLFAELVGVADEQQLRLLAREQAGRDWRAPHEERAVEAKGRRDDDEGAHLSDVGGDARDDTATIRIAHEQHLLRVLQAVQQEAARALYVCR